MHLAYLWLYRIEPHHQHRILFSCDLGRLLWCPRPAERSVFKPFVEQEETGAFPEESFDPVTSFSAEKKQDILLERIQIKTCANKLGQAIDAFSEICIAAGNIYLPDSGSFSQHDLPLSVLRSKVPAIMNLTAPVLLTRLIRWHLE